MKKHRGELSVGLDIGTHTLSVTICEVLDTGDVHVLGAGKARTQGLEKGEVGQSQLLKEAVLAALSQAEQQAGCRPNHILLTVPNESLAASLHTGVRVFKNGKACITKADQLMCIQRSKNVAVPPVKQLLHAMALSYKVDDQLAENPLGIQGEKLAVESYLIFTSSQLINALYKVLKPQSFTIKGIMSSGYAHAQLALNQQEQESGALMIDMGHRQTVAMVIKRHQVQLMTQIPIGGERIIRDISTCLSVSFAEAERLKLAYGTLDITAFDEDETIDITRADGTKVQQKRQLLCQIIEARVRELFLHLLKQCPLLTQEVYPLVMVGNGARLAGLSSFCDQNGVKGIRIVPQDAAVGTVLYGVKTRTIGQKNVPTTWLQRISAWVRQWW